MPTPSQFYDGFAFLMNNSHCVTLGESCLTSFTGTGTRGCPCGTSSFRINAKTVHGTIPINPCVYAHEYKAGDLLADDIYDIIDSPEFRAFGDRRRDIPQVCRDTDCEFLETCRGGCTSRAYLTSGTLDSKDPYCPHDHLLNVGARPDLPFEPEIGCHDGIRVHDNYLCTWIGEVHPDFVDERWTSLDQFTGGAPPPEDHEIHHLSGHIQADADTEPGDGSLIRVSLGPSRSRPDIGADVGRP